jgi:hypothetical protein
VQKHLSHKSPKQCRDVIKAWVVSGVLTTFEYHHPITRKNVKGLKVDDAKRPMVREEVMWDDARPASDLGLKNRPFWTVAPLRHRHFAMAHESFLMELAEWRLIGYSFLAVLCHFAVRHHIIFWWRGDGANGMRRALECV